MQTFVFCNDKYLRHKLLFPDPNYVKEDGYYYAYSDTFLLIINDEICYSISCLTSLLIGIK